MSAEFKRLFDGDSKGALHWHQFERLLRYVADHAADGWYLYDTAAAPPTVPLTEPQLCRQLQDIERDVRQRHAEDYCGIAYADDLSAPRFIKIYDPDNLGVVCGYSENPPAPRWLISRAVPGEIHTLPASPRRGWRAWFSRQRQ